MSAPRSIVLCIVVIALVVGLASRPNTQATALASPALQSPGLQPAPSPGPASGPTTAADLATSGEPGPSDAGVAIHPHELATLPRGERPEQVRQAVPRQYPDPAAFGRQKAAAHQAAAAAEHRPGGTGASAPPPKLGLDINQTGGWNPPDGALAVGPSSLLVAVNEAFAIYNKSTSEMALGPIGFTTFFGTTDSTFDPRALFDAGNAAAGGYGGGSGRFVLLATTSNSQARTSQFTLAVSQNDSPHSATTGWCVYKLNAVTGSGPARTWADFPGLGMDGDYLYITANQFRFGNNMFESARVLAIPKSSVYPNVTTGACPAATSTSFLNLKNPDGTAAFTVQPANQPDALPKQTSTMYFVNATWSSGSNLVLSTLSMGARPRPSVSPAWISSGAIAPYDLPADAPQPGSTGLIDTGDTRLLGAVHRFGKIYTANTTQHVNYGYLNEPPATGPNPSANAQWYEITPGPPSVGASHAVVDPSIAYFFPGVLPGCAAVPCANPAVGLQISGSGASQPASAFTVRWSGAPSLYASGVDGYTLNDRWGDYPGVSSDPSNLAAIWVLGEYAASTTGWGTAVTTVP